MRALVLLMLVLAAGAVAYAPALDAEFQFDDAVHIVDNPAIRTLQGSLERFVADLRGGRPLANLTFAVDYHIAALDVRVFHISSLVWHLATAALVFLFTLAVFRRLQWPGKGEGLSAVVAAAFVLHPLQTEAVTYVVQRAEILSSFFYVATLLLLLATERSASGYRRAAWAACAFLAFLLGMCSKPIIVTAPVAFLLYVALIPNPDARGRAKRWLAALAWVVPMLAASAWFIAIQLAANSGSAAAGFDVPSLTPAQYLLTEARVLLTYLRLLLWPAGQNVDWDYRVTETVRDPATLGSIVGLLAIGASAIVLVRRTRGADVATMAAARVTAFGTAWFVLLLSPTSSVIPLTDVIAEHRVYLASWGIVTPIVAWGGVALVHLQASSRTGRVRVAIVCCAAVCALAAMAVATWNRNHVWATRLSLWADAAAKSPGKARPHANYALGLARQRRLDEAVAEYKRSLLCVGDRNADWYLIRRNFAELLIDLERYTEAEQVLRALLAGAPGDPDLLQMIAVVQLRQNLLDAAEASARLALRANARHAGAHATLGDVMAQRGNLWNALLEFEFAWTLEPDVAGLLYKLARTQDALRLIPQACASWERLLRIERVPPRIAEASSRRAALGCR